MKYTLLYIHIFNKIAHIFNAYTSYTQQYFTQLKHIQANFLTWENSWRIFWSDLFKGINVSGGQGPSLRGGSRGAIRNKIIHSHMC